MQALSEARPGETYTIKWMFGVPEVLEFLHSHHVEEGGTIRLIHRCYDSVIIGNPGQTFCDRRRDRGADQSISRKDKAPGRMQDWREASVPALFPDKEKFEDDLKTRRERTK